MKKQLARTLIYDRLAPLLGAGGFRLKKSAGGFVRAIPNGRQTVGVPFYDYDPEYEFGLTLSVRLDAAEEVFHRFSGSPPEYHAETETAVVTLDYFTGRAESYRVTTSDDVTRAVDGLTPVIRDGLLPFLDGHRDAAAVNRALNHTTPPADTSDHPYRGMHGVVAARLAGDPGFDQIAGRYRREMRDFHPDDREKYEKLVAHLRAAGAGG